MGNITVPHEHGGDGAASPGFQDCKLSIWHINIQGLRSSQTELVARIRLSKRRPNIICVNESFLDETIGAVPVEGFEEVARKDRPDGSGRGGVVVYASQAIAAQLSCVHSSTNAERLWLIIHTEQGPFLLGAWYRPPYPETVSISSCVTEHNEIHPEALGTILLGDLNVHHKSWLNFSSGSSPVGEALRVAAAEMGLEQKVKKPTRGEYLLDLALTDVQGVKAEVLPGIADHCIVEVVAPLPMLEQRVVSREVWLFKNADWQRLNELLYEID